MIAASREVQKQLRARNQPLLSLASHDLPNLLRKIGDQHFPELEQLP
ncbi:hypothetical protein HG15A2_09630 [Adhaeretor mobilis]|uniref:Uncharacterized protein n=1 Tax=Adhaeretor mobilis TaxID=1930276 RepID=A0A517MS40_9BACT|nr:hypothetical protein HG15A2_09630 [Adhaeretor mobilis]